MITDGKQSLNVTSNSYFSYTTDTVKNIRNFQGWVNPNANTIISNFFKAHGFDFPIRITAPEVFGGYTVERLAPDGLPIQYEPLSYPGMLVKLDEQGNVFSFDATLIDFDPTPLGSFGVITAQEALQKLLDDQAPAGKMEASMSTSGNMPREWYRDHPDNQPITIYGKVSSNPNLDTSKPALVLIDGVPAIGNITGMEKLDNYNFIQATGQYVIENGIRKFKVDAWKTNVVSTYVSGALHQDGDQIIVTSDDGSGKQYPLIDPPADLPLNTKPDSMFSVTGVIVNGKIDWTYLQYFENMSHGGGGGGGGLGFYKLNLSGTPVPFPTPTQIPSSSSTGNYVVKANDTLTSIAQAYGVTVDELMQANNITSLGLIQIDQQLIIPGTPPTGQKIDGVRGTFVITIFKKTDGTERTEYILNPKTGDSPFTSLLLEGDNLKDLVKNQNLPLDIWGVLDHYDQYNRPVIKVDRYEIPFPDLKIQLFKGTEETLELNGKIETLLTTTANQKYILLLPNGDLDQETIENPAKPQIIVEGITLPNETYGGYPVLRYFNGAFAINPKTNLPSGFSITANQPYVMDEVVPLTNANSTTPTLNIESVELAYYVSHPHFQVNDPSAKFRATTLQPVWRFYGHYSDGSVFEMLIQALKQEYLTPELVPYITPG